MKIFKSIKWRLQLWYGLILIVVLAGFGFTAYQLERNRLLRQIDDELHFRTGVLGAALHRPPPRRGPPGDDGGFDRLPPDQLPEDRPLDQRPLPRFHLSDQDANFFGAGDPHDFYYSIRARFGGVIAQSTNQPSLSEPNQGHGPKVNEVDQISFPSSERPQTPALPHKILSLGETRETTQMLPSGEMIQVGCSIKPELAELQHTALDLIMAGGLILLVGLAGGGWMVSRSLRPITDISATAVKISAGDLSQRINTADAESELGQLAAVLNSTFARLEAAFAQQRQFASDAAHELRTPVSVILTQTQTSLLRERDAAGYKQTVEACQRAAQRMKKLIESLLSLARFDAGQEVLKRLRFDLSKTAGDCVELVQPLADERGVKVSIEAASLEIIGDPERLAQVITNLLTNAIQYNQPQGEVHLKLKSQDGLAILTVSDTGQGIAAGDLSRLFGRFYRADKSRTGAGNSGLGLAISKAIVEAHAGTIEVASEEHAGTTFTIRLPVG